MSSQADSSTPSQPAPSAPNPGAVKIKDTVLLPQTAFPMKANLTSNEPARLERWEKMGLEKRRREVAKGRKKFILHDGPPYANGHIHMGHALNKILKDLVVRYRSMAGFDTPYIPGWDCHGLPIEQTVLKAIGTEKMRAFTPLQIRKRCHEEAMKWKGTQAKEFQRLFVGGQWDEPYLTLQPEYEAATLKGLRRMVERGLVYHGKRPVYWDWVYRTALAEAEIEYESVVDPSIFVAFPLVDPKKIAGLELPEGTAIVIWTTTPWTLPANVGISMHPAFEYSLVKVAATGAHYVVASDLAKSFAEKCKLGELVTMKTFQAGAFDRALTRHPILNTTSLVMLGEHVTLEQGTGCVHTAPGHGKEDFDIGRAYGTGVPCPVDDDAKFIAGYFAPEETSPAYEKLVGMNVFEANKVVLELLTEKGILLGCENYRHDYPHSWRSHKPIVFRATEQWFMAVDALDTRKTALRIVDEVEWIPTWGRDRFVGMMTTRPDWCLSRQRAWGVPIPALKSLRTGRVFLDLKVFDHVIELVAKEGGDAWFARPVAELVPAGYIGPDGESVEELEKTGDVLDVWFESGASHLAVCEQRPELAWPADLYLEGSDQHRGWFHSSLLVGVATRDAAPFKAVLTHGFLLDAKGEAMSKSKGNVIAPEEVIKKYGSDILRLWVASEDYRGDIKVSFDRFEQLAQSYMRLRNTVRFLLGNLHGFDPSKHAVPVADLPELERFALHRLAEMIHGTLEGYENYEFHRVVQILLNYCSVDLGAFYLDVLKDRLYCDAENGHGRRSAQTVLHQVAHALTRLMAPVLPHTADEAWECLAGTEGLESVHLATLPARHADWLAPELAARWTRLMALRDAVQKPMERARKKRDEPATEEKFIGGSTDAKVTLHSSDPELTAALQAALPLLPEFLIVSKVRLATETIVNQRAVTAEEEGLRGLQILISPAPGQKCERCWKTLEDVGTHADHPTLCHRCATVVAGR